MQKNFSEWPGIHFHKGNVFETLPAVDVGPVAFIHIDFNHPDPEVFGLKTLWPNLVRGGIVLLDDYAQSGRESQYVAINDALLELGVPILTTGTGQGIAVKNR